MPDVYFWLEPGGTGNIFGDSIGFSALNGFADGVEVLDGVKGLHMPPIRTARVPVAGIAGQRRQSTQHDMKPYALPLIVQGASEEALTALLRRWRVRFNPVRGDGQLWVATTDGRLLALTCRYASGMEIDQSADSRFPGAQLAIPTFEADDPYWYDVVETSGGWVLGGVVPKWFAPSDSKRILPLQFAPSSINGTSTLVNDGEVDSWPSWAITGPGAVITVTNETTGRAFSWTGTLADGDRLTIATRPGLESVLVNGVEAWDLFSGDLWPLIEGPDVVTVTLSDATSSSRIDGSFRNGWLGP